MARKPATSRSSNRSAAGSPSSTTTATAGSTSSSRRRPLRGQEGSRPPCKLYRNLGNFKFEDVTAKVGLDKVDFQYSHGAAAFDYDCDGWPDLLVTGYNRLVLLHNEPDGAGGRRFVDVTKKAGSTTISGPRAPRGATSTATATPRSTSAHYGDWGFDTNHPTDCTYDGKTRDVCQPRKFKPLPHTLYRNNRDGTFTDVIGAGEAPQGRQGHRRALRGC